MTTTEKEPVYRDGNELIREEDGKFHVYTTRNAWEIQLSGSPDEGFATLEEVVAFLNRPGKTLADIKPEIRDVDHWGPYIAEGAWGRCPCGGAVMLDCPENECPDCGTLYDEDGDEIL